MKILVKNENIKSHNFGENRNFGQTPKFWSKIKLLVKNLNVSEKLKFFVNSRNFSEKSKF